jgi:hypothetical protein
LSDSFFNQLNKVGSTGYFGVFNVKFEVQVILGNHPLCLLFVIWFLPAPSIGELVLQPELSDLSLCLFYLAVGKKRTYRLL